MNKNLYLPALRGFFGDWVYYSCIMPLATISKMVNFADELHNSKNLSELIQRTIKKRRGNEIASYLTNEKERFFNSLVVAVYGGAPSWRSIGIVSSHTDVKVEDISESSRNSFGFLSFTGEEKMFAIDGQHRLAGIKKAIHDGNHFDNDEVSVLLIAHQNTPPGLQRTRRLFTTLNKTAVKVSKGEIIALDENDVMAITVRRLVENNPFFMNDRIVFKATNNIAPKDNKSLTTIGNLYDVLGVLFSIKTGPRKVHELKKQRPSEYELDQYYDFASDYFNKLSEYIPSLQSFFNSESTSPIVAQNRGPFGGDLTFRPLGLFIMTEVIAKLSAKYGMEESIKRISKLPLQLGDQPFVNVLWHPGKKTMIPRGRVLARDLLLYMLGELPKHIKIDSLRERYAKALGMEVDQVTLPGIVEK